MDDEKGGERQDDVAAWPWIRNGVRWREKQPWQRLRVRIGREMKAGASQ